MKGADWDRFRYYANRVRTICHYDFDDAIGHALNSEVLFLLASHAPVLPKVVEIKWHTSWKTTGVCQPLFFVTPQIKSLDFQSHHESRKAGAAIERLLVNLTTVPGLHLQQFAFHAEKDTAGITRALATFIHSQRGLINLDLEYMELQDEVLDAICDSLPSLRSIKVSFDRNEPTLEVIRKLTKLVSACPAIEDLALKLGTKAPTFQIIQPTLAWRLKRLRILCWKDSQFLEAADQFEAIGAAWPEMQDIDIHQAGSIPLHLLSALVDAFPLILYLYIRLDCRPETNAPKVTRFQDLQELRVQGVVRQEDVKRVAACLVQICPPYAKVIAEKDSAWDDEKRREVKRNAGVWRQILASVKEAHVVEAAAVRDVSTQSNLATFEHARCFQVGGSS